MVGLTRAFQVAENQWQSLLRSDVKARHDKMVGLARRAMSDAPSDGGLRGHAER